MAHPTDDRANETPIPSITEQDHKSGEYKWNKKKCKVFLFDCNESRVEVKKQLKTNNRKPSVKEIRDLKKCLEGWLGKDVVVFKEYRNFTMEMLAEFNKEIQKWEENEKYDCFISIFLTFGMEDMIFCKNGIIPITNIVEPFKKELSMALKPKLFFIQSGDDSYKHYTKGSVKPPTKVPQEADIFIQHSIIPESLFPVQGMDIDECIFLTALKETVQNAPPLLDIHQLSLRINAKVDKRLQSEQQKNDSSCFGMLPIPEVTSTLTKALYFRHGSLEQSPN